MWELVIVRNHKIPETTNIWKPPLLFSSRVTLHLNNISHIELLFVFFALHVFITTSTSSRLLMGNLKKITHSFPLLRAPELRGYVLAPDIPCKIYKRKPRVLFIQFHPPYLMNSSLLESLLEIFVTKNILYR